MSANGAVIAGRGTYEAVGHWGGKNPWDIPLFIVTHRTAEQPPGGEFIFAGSLAEAVDQAQAAAGGKQVHVMGRADVIRQALAAGLVDELTTIIAPVTLGAGKRLFDGFSESLDLEQPAQPEPRLLVLTPRVMARFEWSAGMVEDANAGITGAGRHAVGGRAVRGAVPRW